MVRTVVLLDADTVAGWRRATPSLAQLHQAVADLQQAHPQVAVSVVADPSLKWALADAEQERFESDIVERSVVCAPAGTVGGLDAWVAAVVAKVRDRGEQALVVTDRAVGGVPVVRLGHRDGRFTFDLEGAREVTATAAPAWRRRSGRR
jgi:hypothetical protein